MRIVRNGMKEKELCQRRESEKECKCGIVGKGEGELE
mgnify:CR=1 FL=1